MRIQSRGCFIFQVNAENDNQENWRLVIESRLIMARPVIYSIKGKNMDVFHG